MKKTILFFAMLLSVIAASAKDIKTVVFTTNPVMHCANCENKIKTNLRYEKGIKEIQTNVQEQRVTVNYDAGKTTADNIQKAFTKFGYTATVVGNGNCAKKGECKNGKKEGSCCKAGAGKKEGACCNAGEKKDKGCGGCKQQNEKKESGCGGCK